LASGKKRSGDTRSAVTPAAAIAAGCALYAVSALTRRTRTAGHESIESDHRLMICLSSVQKALPSGPWCESLLRFRLEERYFRRGRKRRSDARTRHPGHLRR